MEIAKGRDQFGFSATLRLRSRARWFMTETFFLPSDWEVWYLCDLALKKVVPCERWKMSKFYFHTKKNTLFARTWLDGWSLFNFKLIFFVCCKSRARAPCCWVWGKINMENSVAIHHWTSSFSSSTYVGVSEMETEKQALHGDEWPYCQHHINIMWQTSLCSTAMSIIIAECWHFETSARTAKWAQKYLPTLARDR